MVPAVYKNREETCKGSCLRMRVNFAELLFSNGRRLKVTGGSCRDNPSTLTPRGARAELQASGVGPVPRRHGTSVSPPLPVLSVWLHSQEGPRRSPPHTCFHGQGQQANHW